MNLEAIFLLLVEKVEVNLDLHKKTSELKLNGLYVFFFFFMEKTDSNQAIEEIILMLLYLARIGDHKNFMFVKEFYAWRGMDFDVIDELERDGCLEQGSYRTKNRIMHLKKKGLKEAKKLLEKYKIKDIEE